MISLYYDTMTGMFYFKNLEISICIDTSFISKLPLTIHDVSVRNALKYDAIFARLTKYAVVKSMIR